MENLKLVASEILEKIMRNWHNLMTKLNLKIQLVKKFEIQNSSALRKIGSGKSYFEKNSPKLGEFNDSIKNISWKLKTLKRRKSCLKKNSRLLRQVIKAPERF